MNDQVMPADLRVITYGVKYKRTPKPAATRRFNCQVLPNPPTALWNYDGRNRFIQQFILAEIQKSEKLTDWWMSVCLHAPLWRQCDLSVTPNPTIAFHCYGGRHRSVAIAEMFASHVRAIGSRVTIQHLELP